MSKQNNDYDIGKAFSAIENELMASMIRNMDRHRAEEAKEGIQWSQWQAEQLKSLEKYKTDNQKKYGSQFKDINSQAEELIRQQRAAGNSSQEEKILKAIKDGFSAEKISPGAAAEFFKLNDRKLDALIKATTNDMKRAETAVLRMSDDQYRKTIYNAQVYANTGAGTYEKAVDMATKDFLSAGLNCIEYANGARHTISDYADMALRTAGKRAYLQGEGEKRKEWGIHTVIMNKRGNPCPLCLPFVGKILIDDVWSDGDADETKESGYELMSDAIATGLYHPRCRDSHTTYFEGISTPPDDKFTKHEIVDIEQQNKQKAQQQYATRQAEKFERLEKFSLDPENKNKYGIRAAEWRDKMAAYEGDKIIWPAKSSKISKEEYRELMSYSSGCGINLSGFKQFDGDVALIKDVVNDANEIAVKFPAVKDGRRHLTIELGNMTAEDFAITNGHIIRLNADAFRSREALEKEYSKLVEEGWFVKGTDYHSIIKHEMGHVVANEYDIDGLQIAMEITGLEKKKTLGYIKENLSEYAWTHADGSEIISEVFSDIYGSNNPHEFSLRFLAECDKIKKKGV